MIRLDGKVAVVTGSGRGLGKAYAKALAEAGASVLVNDLDEQAAAESVAEIVAGGGVATASTVPVGSTESAEAIVDTAVREYGRLDVMCTNAGVLRDRTLKNMPDEDFDLVVATHLRGTFTCGRAAAARFREQGDGGRLILIGSPAGQRGSFGQTNYASAKAGVVAMAWTWAMELARDSVTVNAVIPVALTRMVATIPRLLEAVEAAERGEPIPDEMRASGLGTTDDVAPLIVYLASDASSTVTGQVIGAGGYKLALWSRPQELHAVVRDREWTVDDIADAFHNEFDPYFQVNPSRPSS